MKKSAFKLFILIIFLASGKYLHAQTSSDGTFFNMGKPKKWSVTGYLEDLQGIQFTDINKKWTFSNLIHNHVDVHWYADSNWKFHIGMRNRLFYGDSAALYLLNQSLANGSIDLFDLSKTIACGSSYLLSTTIDRTSVDYTKGKWQVTIGRQRINWGLNFVWNPNDIFNAYSYFYFDYEERPGTDAVRVQYYLNSTSSAEIAYKPGRSAGESTGAGLYRFTKGSYDIQALAGWIQNDFVLGGGWSCVLGKAGFNGELTAFVPRKNFQLSQTVISASAGINYTFPNSLYLHGAYLLNSAGVLSADSLTSAFLLNNVTAKSLSPARHNIFAEAAYQFSPLIRGDLAGIINPADGSFFIGPFFTFSLTNTLEFLAGGQLFFGGQNTIYGNYSRAIYMRLKWSFCKNVYYQL